MLFFFWMQMGIFLNFIHYELDVIKLFQKPFSNRIARVLIVVLPYWVDMAWNMA